MKDFLYINSNKNSPEPHEQTWLRKMGLRETQWILDADWLLRYHPKSVYKEWVGG